MLAPGLGLKGLPLSLFALTASYNRAGCKMYESRESLAGYLGYSERQIGKALNQLKREARPKPCEDYKAFPQPLRKDLPPSVYRSWSRLPAHRA